MNKSNKNSEFIKIIQGTIVNVDNSTRDDNNEYKFWTK